ncbi:MULTISPECIES: hypothetical protein, partial [unclassified Lysinibacillus]|uniref:hypothetical protein n=1 Tax=unclassified Lysinibacillus TaxID=2636778 RepID=UPI00201B351F
GRPLERTLAERKSTPRLAKLLIMPLTLPFFNNMKSIESFDSMLWYYNLLYVSSRVPKTLEYLQYLIKFEISYLL